MAQLTSRIDKEKAETRENRRIPSGYTYLLQLVAHDMADTMVSYDIDGSMLTPGIRNARSSPLHLDTLYGAGPDECPHAYELTKEVIDNLGQVPRIRLRLGPPGEGAKPPAPKFCPFRDIARGTPNSDDTGIAGPGWLTETMLADSRNDAHSILSQLTVVFQLLHNHVVDLLAGSTSTPEQSPALAVLDTRRARRELAYSRFRCARFVVTLIYRNILEKDVLRRILDDRVYHRYMSDSKLPLDSGESIPVEFTFGAFRFAHSIVRDDYMINGLSPQALSTNGALLRTSHRSPGNSFHLPLKPDWLVDWAHFFGPESSPTVNFSKLIGPHYPQVLRDPTGEFAKFFYADNAVAADASVRQPMPAIDAPGLSHRDLLSAGYAGTLSVPALCRNLRDLGFEMVEEFDVWGPRLAAWLPKGDLHFPPGDPDTQRVIDDPPLPFFILFEAANSGGATPGQHLGPVGSIIVAETILGAMKRHPVGVESPGSTLQERIGRCVELFFGEDAARDKAITALADVGEMPKLLDYMGKSKLFAAE